MRKVLVNIADKSYRCEVPETPEERKQGLGGRELLAPDEGMLYIFNDPMQIPQMWMKNTSIPLDIIGIDEDGVVLQVMTPEPMSEELVQYPNCTYILEVNAGSKIEAGDDFIIDEDTDLDKYIMKVLAPDGTAQALLQGGERIFSRISTRRIIKYAKQAFADKDNVEAYEKACKKLGEYTLKELYAQEHRDPEYVTVPDKKPKS